VSGREEGGVGDRAGKRGEKWECGVREGKLRRGGGGGLQGVRGGRMGGRKRMVNRKEWE